MRLIKYLNNKLIGEDKRSALVRKNVFFSLLFKGIAMGTSFFMVPITLDYLNKEIYGVWLAISSILFWFTFLDVGLGSGMRNYLSAALSNNDMNLARKYVSTTFFLLALIAIVAGIVVCVSIPHINMSKVFNTQAETPEILMWSLLVALLATLAFFAIRNVGTVYMSMQMTAVNDGMAVVGSFISLLLVWLLSLNGKGNLLYVVSAFTIPPVLVYFVGGIYTFLRYKELSPSFHSVDLHLSRNIIGKGMGFFIIQITSCLVIYGSSNMFVTQYCGPKEVTDYGIAYKLFNLLYVGYMIYLTPFWNAYTDASVRKDYKWMRSAFRNTLKMWGASVIFGLLLLLLSPWFFKMWVGDNVNISWELSGITLAYICMLNLNSCVTFLLNGLNIIRVQIYTSVIFTLLYLLAVILTDGKWGVIGIISLMTVTYVGMFVVHCYQCIMILNGKAKGIWLK